ncbi:L-amino acid N-acyltransferase YncA [Cupriavidus alkaliphilus]|nr:L-amino acid N-acyltransferase YncA [Cupriavidus alkaliphilus]
MACLPGTFSESTISSPKMTGSRCFGPRRLENFLPTGGLNIGTNSEATVIEIHLGGGIFLPSWRESKKHLSRTFIPFPGVTILSSNVIETVPAGDVGLLWERACFGVALGSCCLPVRNLQGSDLEQLVPMVHAAFSHTVDSAPLESWRRKLLAIVGHQYGSFVSSASFVAEVSSGQLAGTVLVTDFARYQAPVIALIAVSPGVQDKGVGFYLLRRSLQALAIEGFPKCRAKISPGNNASLQLFRNAGFELCRVEPKSSQQGHNRSTS